MRAMLHDPLTRRLLLAEVDGASRQMQELAGLCTQAPQQRRSHHAMLSCHPHALAPQAVVIGLTHEAFPLKKPNCVSFEAGLAIRAQSTMPDLSHLLRALKASRLWRTCAERLEVLLPPMAISTIT